MENVINELTTLFEEAKGKNEFEFILTLINFKGMASIEDTLHEWFEAIEMYKRLYAELNAKEKTRMACLLYSTFFENSDFYNILGSLCNITLGYRGSSYFFWKTRKQDRLMSTAEKINLIVEILNDCGKQNTIQFFTDNHYSPIRNTFFHAAYSLNNGTYNLHDTDPIRIDGVGRYYFDVQEFFYPIVDNVINFFNAFKNLYINSFASYKEDKIIKGFFPFLRNIEIKGSENGLNGFIVRNTAQFFGKWVDTSIAYNKKLDMWQAWNITINPIDKERIEIEDKLTRYEKKNKINLSDAEFFNLGDKVIQRNLNNEMVRLVELLVKFGDKKYDEWKNEENLFRKANLPKGVLPFYQKADKLNKHLDSQSIRERIKELTENMEQ